MRPNPITIPALALIILFSSSCKKSSNSTPANKSGTATGTSWSWTGTAPLSAEIDGVPYQATMTGPAIGISSVLAFNATNSSDTSFTVFIDKVPTANAIYSFDGSDSSAFFSFTVTSAASESVYSIKSGTGKIKIIAITDTTVEGQFYGTVYNNSGAGVSHTITNGYFKAPRY